MTGKVHRESVLAELTPELAKRLFGDERKTSVRIFSVEPKDYELDAESTPIDAATESF